ncbi:MAG: helix-turn-helix transcriptional regulator [Methanomassiliicoccales archaeon]
MNEYALGRFSRGGVRSDPEKVWLQSSYRVMLIKEGIEKAGSINKLGRELGYRSRVHPGWSIRQILLGYQPFPLERLKKLAQFLGTPMSEIMEHQARPGSVTVESTRDALIQHGLFCYFPR